MGGHQSHQPRFADQELHRLSLGRSSDHDQHQHQHQDQLQDQQQDQQLHQHAIPAHDHSHQHCHKHNHTQDILPQSQSNSPKQKQPCPTAQSGCCSAHDLPHSASILSSLMPHSHGITTHHAVHDQNKLALALCMYLILLVAELVAAALSRSRILAVEGLHAALDALTVLFALVSIHVAQRPPDPRGATFGYARAEVLTALISVLWLFTIMAALVYSSARVIVGIDQPDDVHGAIVVVTAAAAFATNFAVHFVLRPTPNHDPHADIHDLERAQEQEALNVKAARAHALADSMESLVALFVGIAVIVRPTWTLLDPILGIIIAVFVIVVNWTIVRDAWAVLMEFAPRSISMQTLAEDFRSIQGVHRVDNLHVWKIGMAQIVGTVRLRLDMDDGSAEQIDILRQKATAIFEESGVHESFTETIRHRGPSHHDHDVPSEILLDLSD